MRLKNRSIELNIFYFLALAGSGALYGLASLISKALSLDGPHTVLVAMMGAQLAPGIAALICKRIFKNPVGIGAVPELNPRLLLAIMVPLISVLSQHFVLEARGERLKPSVFFGSIGLGILTVITTFVGSFFEEIGWRGYLHGTLRQKIKPWHSALLTSLLWGIWHFTKALQFGFTHFLLFVLTILPLGFIMVYLYEKAGGCLVPSTILHAVNNLAFMYFLYERESTTGYIVSFVSLMIIVLLIFLLDREFFRRDKVSGHAA